VKLDEGTLESAKVNLDYAQIRAPISGRVGLRQTDPGNIVPANGTTPLLTITQLEPITVIFTMAEDYISEVSAQMRAGHKMRVDALSRDNQNELAQGTLLTVDNQVDTTTGTVKVRANFQNHDYRLFPNEFVNAKLLVRTLMGVNIIPNSAIQRNNDVSFVYVIGADNTVKSRDIKVATSDGNNSAVTGVTPGETVVTDGFDKLQDGMKVVLRKEVPPASGPGNKMNQSQETRRGRHRAQPAHKSTPRSRTRSRAPRSESVSPVYFKADCHIAAHGSNPAHRHRRVQTAPRFSAAGSRLSDHPGHDILPGREPRSFCLSYYGASRTTAGRGAGPESDAFHEFRRGIRYHAAVCSQLEHRCR
jgi:hypothetical protein